MTNSKEAYLGGTFEDYKAIENTDRKINYFSGEKKYTSTSTAEAMGILFIKDVFHLLHLCSFPVCQDAYMYQD